MKHYRSDEITGRHLDMAILRRFIPLIRPYWKKAVASLSLLPLISLVRIVPPLLIKFAIDESIIPGNLDKLWPVSAMLVALLLIEGGVVFAQSILVQIVGQHIMADLRRDSFAKLMRLPRHWYDWQPSGRLITRLTTDIENVGELFGSGIVSAIGDIATLVLILIIMLSMNWQLAVIAFAVVPLLLLVIYFIRRPMRKVTRQLRARQAGLNAFITERLNGIAEVQIFSQEKSSAGKFEQLQQQYRTSSLNWVTLEALFYASVHICGSLAVAAILWQGGDAVMHQVATFGTLVAFIEYARKFFLPLTELASKFSVLQTSNSALERIFDLLDQPEEKQGGAEPAFGPGSIEFKEIHFSYDKTDSVLKGVSFSVAPGQRIALVGETGSGKTTLTKLLLGFYQPDSGQILFNGNDVATLANEKLRQQIGWVSQEPFVFSGSVRDNLDPEHVFDDKYLLDQLYYTGALPVVQRLGGLDALLGEHGKNLSSGERQLLCLTRAQVKKPQVIILDEATSHLDGDSEELVYNGIRAVAGGRTTLMIVHHLRLAAEADRIVMLYQGKICEQGSHQQLMQLNGRYAQLWQIQQLEKH
ncbi:MAG: hypothetical protein B6I36_06030 [Desulfobacteraceae bacterium 4572_35.1]|nr:MAG: hypothetical protein B6I36_06030 [Desulfobacteraceae bacterium 4572_35.1]